MIGEELARLATWRERHRRLLARVALALALTLVVDAFGSVAIYLCENGRGDIDGFGDAVFFSTVQLLTISSSMANPITPAGMVVDVFLELWAIFVVAAVAGSFAAFFGAGDS